MSIPHKFKNHNWNNGFSTLNTILQTPYPPEVLIVGTYNPDIPGNDRSDFFYSRNYFWPALFNLFEYGNATLKSRRLHANPTIPTLRQIFSLCSRLKLGFCDLIEETMMHNNPHYHVIPKNKIRYLAKDISLISDDGLSYLNSKEQVLWNTTNIIDFLNGTPSIKFIYFTRKPTGIWKGEWEKITTCNHSPRSFSNIFTPSGQSLVGKPRMNHLLKSWVHNNNPNFGRLDNQWLSHHGVVCGNFFS